jgi:hypothetical protein
MKTRNALVVGFDYYGRFLVDLINEHSTSWTLHYRSSTRVGTLLSIIDACTVDAIISFGGPGPNAPLADLARRRNIPVIVIWAGTDVLAAKADPLHLELIKNYRFTNVSDGPWLIDELRELGIDARYVPVTAIRPAAEIAEFPKEFNVLTYLPEPRREFYGERAVYDIAAAFPEIPFTVVGRGEHNPVAPRNVRFLGYVDDMQARLDRSSVLLRLPKHDGKSMLVLEALARGRHVIWNYDFPGVHYAAGVTDAVNILHDLKQAHDAGELTLNSGGYAYVTQGFRRPQLASQFEGVLDGAMRSRPSHAHPQRRVAISGLELFTAQIARELERRPNGWRGDPLRLRGRLEVANSMIALTASDVWYSIGTPIGDRWLHLFARLLNKPRVIHWVGSDIISLRTNPGLRRWCQSRGVHNLAEAAWTIEELRSFGIQAKLAPLPPRILATRAQALPAVFTVLFYLPKTRGDFYGRREYERLIRAFAGRNVRFYIVGGGECYAPPTANVTRLGWLTSLRRVYADTTVLVRFTARDGLSLMTLEALAHGRHVLWTKEFPFVTHVRTYDEMQQALSELLGAHERGELEPQDQASRYIAQTYSPQRCMEAIVSTWDEAV